MSSMLDRARTALDETHKRLAHYSEEINRFKILQNEDIEKQLKLEDYILKQEAIACDSAELLDFGIIPAEVIQTHSTRLTRLSGVKRGSGTRMPLDIVRNNIFPRFRSHFNGNGFSIADFAGALKMEGVDMDRKTVANWLSNNVRSLQPDLIHVGIGRYGFKSQEVVNGEEIPCA